MGIRTVQYNQYMLGVSGWKVVTQNNDDDRHLKRGHHSDRHMLQSAQSDYIPSLHFIDLDALFTSG